MLAAARETVEQPPVQSKEEVGNWLQEPWSQRVRNGGQLRGLAQEELKTLLEFVDAAATSATYEKFEKELIGRVFRLARLLVVLFLTVAAESLVVPSQMKLGRRVFRRQPAKPRLFGTFFGKVRYWRVYLHQTNGRGGGFYPLDQRLGLTADGFSLGVLSRAVRLATMISYSLAARVMASFLGWAPATKTIECAALGLGAHTTAWFESAEAPRDDGEVLIIQVDSKATPTATEAELRKRRGKRPAQCAPSPRHRGRGARARRGPKKRRRKGDKSKNGRAATLLVMYTLKRSTAEDGSPLLLGPLNRRIYASYAPKRHAFEVARREANKRGFTEGSGKYVQIVTDGDEDLARYAAEFFPTATHTLDVIHVVERLWDAGACLHPEGSDDLAAWVERQRDHLYEGRTGEMLLEIQTEFAALPPGPKRSRLDEILGYLVKRTHMMNYAELAAQDLELASGSGEGAVRFVISQRFDEAGMRWIKARAEALLQLRCIDINGDWEHFVEFVHARLTADHERRLRPPRLLRKRPKPLPSQQVAS
jgi:hypothetical protein